MLRRLIPIIAVLLPAVPAAAQDSAAVRAPALPFPGVRWEMTADSILAVWGPAERRVASANGADQIYYRAAALGREAEWSFLLHPTLGLMAGSYAVPVREGECEALLAAAVRDLLAVYPGAVDRAGKPPRAGWCGTPDASFIGVDPATGTGLFIRLRPGATHVVVDAISPRAFAALGRGG
ncbi:MAG TPA: hypothetical protein VFQ45_17240 [Longimicrobium sp.]|nr:hypothetical protein [Longimicrobium sp.]